MDIFFNPRSIVVFGVSNREGNLGKGVLYNLDWHKWEGKRWGIGRRECEVFGARVHTSLDDINETPELAVILTPAGTVPDVFEECAKKGVRRIIVESGGFGEWSDEMKSREARMLETAKKHHIRFIGPNCIGTINLPKKVVTAFGKRENFARIGDVSIISQSGGVYTWFAGLVSGEGLGFNKGVSVGNKLNVDETDILDYYAKDKSTGSILMYLEDIRDGGKFFDVAAECTKPIIALKANSFPETNAIASSHTAAMASNDKVVDGALRQAGVCRPRGVPELINAVKGFALPRMKGNGLAIVSRSGGHAVIAADRAAMHGFEMAKFSDKTMERLEKVSPTTRIVRQNPLDIGDVFNIAIYAPMLEAVLADPQVDGVEFIHTFPSRDEIPASKKLLDEIVAICKENEKPVSICFTGLAEQVTELKSSVDYPIFGQPENAIDALAASRNWWERRKRIETVRGVHPVPK